MKFFIDTADVQEIRSLAATGLVDGVTTNPTLAAKTGRPLFDIIAEICEIVDGPVSAEVLATEAPAMVREANVLRTIAENVAIKLPLTFEGLRACRILADDGAKVNMTLCFSATQAILAAKAGAAFVSPFVGRLDDIGEDGMGLVDEIVRIYNAYPRFETEVLVASVRNPGHVLQAALLGADIVTLPPKILRQLVCHPLTDAGLAAFLADAKKAGLVIPGAGT